jgi:hypothetical protein
VFFHEPFYIKRQCQIGSSLASHSGVWGSNIRPDTDYPEVPLLSLSGNTLPQYYHLLAQPSISLTSNNPTTRRYIHCRNANREQIVHIHDTLCYTSTHAKISQFFISLQVFPLKCCKKVKRELVAMLNLTPRHKNLWVNDGA